MGLVVLRSGFHSRKRLFFIFFNTQGPVIVDILPRRLTLIATSYYVETVLSGVKKSIRQQRPAVGTIKTIIFSLHFMTIDQCPQSQVIVAFLMEQSIQFLTHSALQFCLSSISLLLLVVVVLVAFI